MAAVRKYRPKASQITVDYDRDVDVLYVAIGKPRPGEGEDRPGGIVYRYAVEDDTPCGLTIVGFRRNEWHTKPGDLAKLIADHLGADVTQIEPVIREATALG